MIIAYCPSTSGLNRVELGPGETVPATSIWIDLLRPTHEEQLAAEKLMGAEIPTREEIASIETSARLYEEPGAIVMTALLPMAATTLDPELSSVTFVVSSKRLVTVRYGEPTSIERCARKVQADPSIAHNGPAILFSMLDIVVDRCADVMEAASGQYDELAQQVFNQGINSRSQDSYQTVITSQGLIGLKVAKMHDVCASLSRMLLFLSAHAKKVSLNENQIEFCNMYGTDVHSIKEHGDALDNKLSFLLDATVGLVTLEQNQIFKIFSILGVIFLPPTLIASIYGMNFANMPEFSWQYGFWFSVGLMVSSVALTFVLLRIMKLF